MSMNYLSTVSNQLPKPTDRPTGRPAGQSTSSGRPGRKNMSLVRSICFQFKLQNKQNIYQSNEMGRGQRIVSFHCSIPLFLLSVSLLPPLIVALFLLDLVFCCYLHWDRSIDRSWKETNTMEKLTSNSLFIVIFLGICSMMVISSCRFFFFTFSWSLQCRCR